MDHPSKTEAGLAATVGALRRQFSQHERARKAATRAARRLHDAVWDMRSDDPIDRVVSALRASLLDTGIGFCDCGVNVVEPGPVAGVAMVASTGRQDNRVRCQSGACSALVHRTWKSGQIAYRPNLAQFDGEDEREALVKAYGHNVLSVVDVPFSHGTLAINSDQAEAFSPDHLAALESLAEVLSDAFRRRDDLLQLAESQRRLSIEAAERAQAQLELSQANATLHQALASERLFGHIRDQVLELKTLAGLGESMQGEWLAGLRQLGLPVYRLSVQTRSARDGYLTVHWAMPGTRHYHATRDYSLTGAPWVAQAWATGQPVVVTPAGLRQAGFAADEVQSLLEVPFAGGDGSLGVSSTVAGAFDEGAVRLLTVFGGLVATALRRLRDLEALHESETRYRRLADELPIGIANTCPDGRILYHNPHAQAVLGYDAEQLTRLSADALYVNPADRDELMRTLRECGYHSYEYQLRRRTGETVWVRGSTRLVHDNRGAPMYQGCFEDVTERRRAEEVLRLRGLVLDQIADCVRVTDLAGVITYVNHAEEQALGRARERITGQLITAVDDDPQASAAWRRILAATQADGQWRGEVTYRGADGGRLLMDCRTRLVRDAAGRPVAVCCISSDVTERTRLQREIESQRLKAVEVDRLHALGEMASGMAHELNQPLNGIRAFAEGVLLAPRVGWSPTRGDVCSALQDIVAQVDRMSELIDHMRAFARDEGGLDPEPFQVEAAVHGALKLVGAQLRVHGIAVCQELAAATPWCCGWPHALEQVVLNLVANARDALDERQQRERAGEGDARVAWSPRLTLRTGAGPDPASLFLEVADNGGGIAPDVVDRIFEPFFTTKSVGRGTGLGLAISRAITEKHSGRIEVDNRPGEGVTFRLVVPAVPPPVPLPSGCDPATSIAPEIADPG
jgi:PAS domain S-box-containing protein